MTPPATFEAFASAVNYILLDPELTNSEIVEGLETAKRYAVGVVTVRPCDVDTASRVLAGSPVRLASVAAYPHGFQTTSVKLYEVRDLLRRGAKEVAAVIGAGRLRSREFQHLQTELNQVKEACAAEGATFTALLDVARLTTELKIIAYTCCERAEVDGAAPLAGWTDEDLALMRKHLPDEAIVEIPASSLDEALRLLANGATRVSTLSPATMCDEFRRRLSPAT